MCRLSYLVYDIKVGKQLPINRSGNYVTFMDYLDNINLEEKLLDITSFNPISVYRNSHNYNISNQLLHLNFIHLIYYLNNTVDLNYNENQINHILKIYKDYELSTITFEKIFLTICKYLKIINITSNNGKCNIEINNKFLDKNINSNNNIVEPTDNKRHSCCKANSGIAPTNTDEPQPNTDEPPSNKDNAESIQTDIPSVQFINKNTTILDILNIISKVVDNKLCIVKQEKKSYMHLLSFFDQLEQIPTIKFISSGIQEISYRDKFKKNPTYKLLTYIKEKDSANEQLAQHIKTSDIQLKKELRNFHRPPKIVLTSLFNLSDNQYLCNVKDNTNNVKIVGNLAGCNNNCNYCTKTSTHPHAINSTVVHKRCRQSADWPISWNVDHSTSGHNNCEGCYCGNGANKSGKNTVGCTWE